LSVGFLSRVTVQSGEGVETFKPFGVEVVGVFLVVIIVA
jgi:hypothetical protein